MASVFLNYRRQDSSGYAGRIFDRLVATFGKEQIFRDIDRIEPGLDFTEVIDQSLKSCVAVLVLIGPKWLELKNEDGKIRLHAEVDYVRFEIEQALERDIRVIPVLLPSVRDIPSSDLLPESISRLAKRHAFRLTEESWNAELDKLSALLIKLGLEPLKPKPAPPGRNPLLNRILMGLGVLFLIGIIASVFVEEEMLPDPTPMPAPTPPYNPTPAPTPAPAQALTDRDSISTMQRALSALGYYDGGIDGISGPQSIAALREFQADEGLQEDGRLTTTVLANLLQQAPPIPPEQQNQPAQIMLGGTWYDNYANRYEISHNGNQVSAAAYTASGEYLGEFQGTLSGTQLNYSYETVVGTSGSGRGVVQADRQHINTVAADYGSATSENNQLHRGHLPP